MSLTPLASTSNPLYRALLGLAESPRDRRERGATLLDGEHLLQAALDAGQRPTRLIYAAGAAAGPLEAWRRRLPDIPVVLLADGLFARLTPSRTPTGLLAEIPIPRATARNPGFIVLLEDLQDPGNLGALLRTAAAAGVEEAWLSTACADPWSPKALRGGQGAQFALAIRERVDLAEAAADFPGVIHAAVLGAQTSLHDLALQGPIGFAFGNEGAGLSPRLIARAQPFAIPMPGRVESLNVAAAAAICLFERARQVAQVSQRRQPGAAQ